MSSSAYSVAGNDAPMNCSRRWMTRGDAQHTASFSYAPTIVCVIIRPAGIAHTYMAAEYLEKAGRKLGVNIYVEKQVRITALKSV